MKGSGETKLLLILGLIVAFGIGAMLLLEKVKPPEPAPVPTPKPFAWDATTYEDLLKEAHIQENPGAKVTVVEFADFQCPSCRRAYNTVLNKMEKKKSVRFVFHHFPLVSMHENAMSAAISAEAAAKQGKFWEMYDALFEGEKTELGDTYYEKCAKKIGLDMDKFKKDTQDALLQGPINKDLQLGQTHTINSTPTFVIKNAEGKITQVVGGKDLEAALKTNGITL